MYSYSSYVLTALSIILISVADCIASIVSLSSVQHLLRVGLESDPTIQVYSFDNPVSALVEFEPNFYDLLLIDVNMPLMDGFQLAQNLVRRDLNVRVCFMTAGEINMDAAREVHPLKSIGCFIKKPISAEELLRRIRAELE